MYQRKVILKVSDPLYSACAQCPHLSLTRCLRSGLISTDFLSLLPLLGQISACSFAPVHQWESVTLHNCAPDAFSWGTRSGIAKVCTFWAFEAENSGSFLFEGIVAVDLSLWHRRWLLFSIMLPLRCETYRLVVDERNWNLQIYTLGSWSNLRLGVVHGAKNSSSSMFWSFPSGPYIVDRINRILWRMWWVVCCNTDFRPFRCSCFDRKYCIKSSFCIVTGPTRIGNLGCVREHDLFKLTWLGFEVKLLERVLSQQENVLSGLGRHWHSQLYKFVYVG